MKKEKKESKTSAFLYTKYYIIGLIRDSIIVIMNEKNLNN